MEITGDILAELEKAEAARLAGNEGRARVCARRAAGLAARDYLSRIQGPHDASLQPTEDKPSAYAVLKFLAAMPGLAPDLQQAAFNLTMRVTEEFALPVNIDLIAEARKLISGLP